MGVASVTSAASPITPVLPFSHPQKKKEQKYPFPITKEEEKMKSKTIATS